MDFKLIARKSETGNVSTSSYVRPFTDDEVTISAAILILFMVVGIAANALTIAVIMSYKSLSKNVFMRFIVSLCTSDLASALISWLNLYRRTWGFDDWNVPPLFCQLYWATDITTSYVTSLHIFSFAVLRYISIRFPMVYNRISVAHGNAWISGIWLLSVISGFLPFCFMFGVKRRNRLERAFDSHWPACTVLIEQQANYKVYQAVVFPLFFLLPAVGVLAFCLMIVLLVCRKADTQWRKTQQALMINLTARHPESRKQQAAVREKRMRKEKQAVLQLFLIMLSFLLGYIPFIVYEFWSLHNDVPTNPRWRLDYWFGMSEYFLLRFSECLNPLFYNFGSTKMRRHTAKFVKQRLLCRAKRKCGRAAAKVGTRGTGSATSEALRTMGSNMGL